MSGLQNKRTIGMIAVVLVVVAGGLWAAAGRFGDSADAERPVDPTVERLKQLPFNEMREAVRSEELTEEQRRELFQSRRREMEQKMQERMDEYFAAAPEDREAVLDRHIDEFVERMKDWQAEREKREKERKDEKTDDKGDGQRGERRNWTRSREESKARMEGGDPDQRKQQMIYRNKMRERMQARGIEMGRGMRGPGGRGGPGGGGPGGRGGGGGGGGGRGGNR